MQNTPTQQNTKATTQIRKGCFHYLCTGGWTSSLQPADSCRTDARVESGACRWSARRSAGRRNVPPPGVQRAQASPPSPCSTAGAAADAVAGSAAAFAFALHSWPPGPEPPQPDSSSSGPDHTTAGISLLTHAHTMRWGPYLTGTHSLTHNRSAED